MPIKDTTENKYTEIVESLKKRGVLDLHKVKTADEIIDVVTKQKSQVTKKYLGISTQKLYLSAAMWFFKNVKENDTIVSKLSNKLSKYKSEPDKEVSKNKLTDKQRKTFVTWKKILSIFPILKDQSDISHSDYVKYLIYCMYVLQPPRRLEYHKLKIISKASDAKDKTINYYVNVQQSYFLLYDHKNANRNGKQNMHKVMVSAPLREVINTYIEEYEPEKYLLNITTEALRSRIRSIFKEHLKKDVSIDVLRHSYKTFLDTKKIPQTTRQKEIVAGKMGHSVHMNDKYSKRGEKFEDSDESSSSNSDQSDNSSDSEPAVIRKRAKKKNTK